MSTSVALSAQEEAYEADLERNPYSLKNWLFYLTFKQEAQPSLRFQIYERALQRLPRSYKLWHAYLNERCAVCLHVPLNDPMWAETALAFERAMVHMHKMPVIWRQYLEFKIKERYITSTRRTFDKALCALPVTQHIKFIWPSYIRFAAECGVPETAMRIWRRYIKIHPKGKEEYLDTLIAADRIDEATVLLAELINDDKFVSQRGRTKHDLWIEMLKLVVQKPSHIHSINVDAMIRSGIRRYPHEVARLWTALADYHQRLGQLDTARHVYSEAIESVLTVRDFAHVFSAFTAFENALLTAKVRQAELLERVAQGDLSANKELVAEGGVTLKPKQAERELTSTNTDIDIMMLRLQRLVDERPMLANSVLLRQNPNNVDEWLNRVKLCGDDALKVVKTFTQAVTAVDPLKAEGRLHLLWVRFALFYSSRKQYDDARAIFNRAISVEYKTVEALAHVYCRWAEMELVNGFPDNAIAVAQLACTPPKDYRSHKPSHEFDTTQSVQSRLYRHTRVWSLLADLQENYSSLDATCAVYDRAIQLRVITPQMLLNYAALLEEHKRFEEAFRVYEKGIAVFTYPHVAPIWLCYLRKFVSRNAGRKLERTRDLFEQACRTAPKEHSRKLYLLYAKFEETYGLGKSMTAVYERAVQTVPEDERLDVYFVYIARVTEVYGAVRTREIYDAAMQAVNEKALPELALRYAGLERRLGEVDRARAIYTFACQSADPRKHVRFWNEFKMFETQHGNEDTIRDMIKMRRAVQAHFSQFALLDAAKDALEKQNATTSSSSSSSSPTATAGIATEKKA